MKESGYLKENIQFLEKFRGVPLLRLFRDGYLKHIIGYSKIRQYAAGEEIISEGAADQWFYILLSGVASVYRDEEEIAEISGLGEVFGEASILEGRKRIASVYAARETICLAIDVGFVHSSEEPEKSASLAVIYRFLAEILAQRLEKTNEELRLTRREIEMIKASRWLA